MATTARMSRLSNISKSMPVATELAAPKSAPATPAMAAESMKTPSLVVRSERPSVAQAASESFMPTSTRPKGPAAQGQDAHGEEGEHHGQEDGEGLGRRHVQPEDRSAWGR